MNVAKTCTPPEKRKDKHRDTISNNKNKSNNNNNNTDTNKNSNCNNNTSEQKEPNSAKTKLSPVTGDGEREGDSLRDPGEDIELMVLYLSS